MSDSIPTRYQLRVKQRRRVVEYAETHGLRAASRHFGPARRTVRVWFRRWKSEGQMGLVPRYPQRRKRRVALVHESCGLRGPETGNRSISFVPGPH
jgi:transposase